MEIVHEQSTEFLRVSANSCLEIFDMVKETDRDITLKKAGSIILALSGIQTVDKDFTDTSFRGLVNMYIIGR